MTFGIKLSRSAAELGCSERTRAVGYSLDCAWQGREGVVLEMHLSICIEHEECRQRRRRAFELRGQTRSADVASVALKLTILSCGDCGTTQRKLRADSGAEDPATFTGRKRVREAVKALAADDETVTPVRVARKIAVQELPSMNPDSLRYYTREFRPPQGQARKATDRKQQPCIAEVSRSEWEALVSQHSDGTGLLQIVHTLPSGSFVGFLPPMLQELKSLHLQGFGGQHHCGGQHHFWRQHYFGEKHHFWGQHYFGEKTIVGDNTTLRDNSTLRDNTTLQDNTTVGDNTTVRDNTTLGNNTTFGGQHHSCYCPAFCVVTVPCFSCSYCTLSAFKNELVLALVGLSSFSRL